MVRAEMGAEKVEDRWVKLKLGFWHHVFTAPTHTLLRTIAEYRRNKWRFTLRGENKGKKQGWIPTAYSSLYKIGLGHYFYIRDLPSKEQWRDIVYKAVEAKAEDDRKTLMNSLPSTDIYRAIKEWGCNAEDYSFSKAEQGQRGALVPERYLDDRTALKATRLKLLCRLGCLPLMNRVGREAKPVWPKSMRSCLVCGSTDTEDVTHFILDCSKY